MDKNATKTATEVYPYNLLVEVFDSEENARKAYLDGFNNAVLTLPDREQRILMLRFERGMTLDNISKEVCVSRERVRQLLLRAIRRLRHPSRKDMMTGCSLSEVKKMYVSLLQKIETVENKIDIIKIKTVEEEDAAEALSEQAGATSPSSLALNDIGFSVRTYNCLARAGVKTAADIQNMSETKLKSVRNMGLKSVSEVIEKMRQYGWEIAYDNGGDFESMAFVPSGEKRTEGRKKVER